MKQILNRLFEHQYLNRDEAREVLTRMATGEYNNAQIAAFISVFLMRNISIDEFTGFSEALLNTCTDVSILQKYDPVDIVGTGGDNKNTFNISTLSCFVVASLGYKVAKHGNYGATSVSGASNVMELHGVKFTANIDMLERSLDQCNIAFLHAPLFNNAMKVVAPIRKDLSVRTFFNMLGPVINPIKPKKNVLGVYNLRMARLYYYIYQNTDCDYSIVHSLDGYDEISLTGSFKVISRLGEEFYLPEDIGFPVCQQTDLYGGDTPQEASNIFDRILDNTATEAQKNAVIANSAFTIRTICPNLSIEECIARVRETLNSGNVKRTFKKFLEING